MLVFHALKLNAKEILTLTYGLDMELIPFFFQFHFVNSNSASNLSIPVTNLSIPIPFFTDFFTYYFLLRVDTPNAYSKYLLGIPTPYSLYTK